MTYSSTPASIATATPDRMHLIDIAVYCKRKGLTNTADWAISMIDSANTIDRYFVDTKVVQNMFTLGGTDPFMWRALQSEVTTFIGMEL